MVKLGIILAVALLLRIGFGMTRADLEAATDEAHWFRLAEHFVSLGPLHVDTGTYRPPLYPLFLAIIFDMVGTNIDAVRFVQSFMGVITCGLLFLIGRRTGDERVGLIAAGLGAVYPFSVFFAGVVMVETLLVLLTVISLFLMQELQWTPSVRRAAVLGGVLGLGALCKPVLLAWVAVLAVGVLVQFQRTTTGIRVVCKYLAVVTLALCLVIAPWTLRNYTLTGYFLPISSNAGMNLLIGHEPNARGTYRHGFDYVGLLHRVTGDQLDAVYRERAALRKVVSWMVADPARTVRLSLRKLVLFWSPVVAGETVLRKFAAAVSYVPVVLLGVWGTWMLRRQPIAWPVAALAISFSAVHVIFFAHTRFRLPVDAVLMVPAAWSISFLLSKWPRS